MTLSEAAHLDRGESWSVSFEVSGLQRTVSARTCAATAPQRVSLLLAHGAGAGQDHPFMVAFARGLASRGIETSTFNFPYTEQRRRLPDPGPVLEACFRAVTRALSERRPGVALFIGGKSMGGRIASLVAADSNPPLPVAGLVFLGYPLHAPGRPDQLRTRHWPAIRVPALFVQGTRDAFGPASEVAQHLEEWGARAALHPVEGGDHSFRISRQPADAAYGGIMDEIVRWLRFATRVSRKA